MNFEYMLMNLYFLFSKEDVSRFTFNCDEANTSLCINLDLHGLSRKKAKWMIQTVVRLCRDKCELNVIHGYNHGTALKEMIVDTDFGQHVIGIRNCAWNPGVTIFSIVP